MYLFSKLDNKGMRDLECINMVGELFELIGIYNSCDINNYDEFINFYNQNVGTTKHHYRNLGETEIKTVLHYNGVDIPRHVFRIFSETWKNVPVVSHTDTGIIFDTIIDRIHSSKILWRIATEKILPKDYSDCIMKILYFQYDNVLDYVNSEVSKRKEAFKALFTEWKNNQITNYLRS
jgi:hypothetical protein